MLGLRLNKTEIHVRLMLSFAVLCTKIYAFLKNQFYEAEIWYIHGMKHVDRNYKSHQIISHLFETFFDLAKI
jgi:hypothetical protein